MMQMEGTLVEWRVEPAEEGRTLREGLTEEGWMQEDP